MRLPYANKANTAHQNKKLCTKYGHIFRSGPYQRGLHHIRRIEPQFLPQIVERPAQFHPK